MPRSIQAVRHLNFSPNKYRTRNMPNIAAKSDFQLEWLRWMQLADSALPIGGLAHSFGLESAVSECGLQVEGLEEHFHQWLLGSGQTEAWFCLAAASVESSEAWEELNNELSAMRPALESRRASLSLGRRFLSMASQLIDDPWLRQSGDAHLACAFGLTAKVLQADSSLAAAAYLHQSIFGAVSVCQRLLSFGQSAAMGLLWRLRPLMGQVIEQACQSSLEDLWNSQPLLEIASMRHPYLATRLFIS